VNYLSNTVTELAASNLKILQVVPTAPIRSGHLRRHHGTSLVAVYTGEILVFNTKRSRRSFVDSGARIAECSQGVAVRDWLSHWSPRSWSRWSHIGERNTSRFEHAVVHATRRRHDDGRGRDGAGYLTILFANAGVTCELSGYPSVQFFVPHASVCVVRRHRSSMVFVNSHHAGSSRAGQVASSA